MKLLRIAALFLFLSIALPACDGGDKTAGELYKADLLNAINNADKIVIT